MPIKKCPHCKTRIVMESYTTDIMHQCNSGNPTLDNEDKKDLTKSLFAGMANKLQGTNSNITQDKKLYSRTARGNNALTHKTRQRIVHIDYDTNLIGRNPTT